LTNLVRSDYYPIVQSDQRLELPPLTVPPRPNSDSDVARLRREQIVEAAVEIITSQGLHNLSLSKIETRAGMKRGQLTYYFPTKEDILLAVFDRLLLLLCEQIAEGQNPDETRGVPNVWDCVQKMLQGVLYAPPKFGREFHTLQYTFLAQIAHRDDFRQKLASVYREWRQGMAGHWQVSAKPGAALAKNVSGQTVSSFVQALMHGLTIQLAADPDAFDRSEMLTLCLGALAPLFTTPPADAPAKETIP
jgi:AcrR family transcriptional regulator